MKRKYEEPLDFDENGNFIEILSEELELEEETSNAQIAPLWVNYIFKERKTED